MPLISCAFRASDRLLEVWGGCRGEHRSKGRVGDDSGTIGLLSDIIVSHHRNVESVANSRRALLRFTGYLRRNLVLVLVAISFCALILFPLADCFDCDGPHPWGRNDAAYLTRSMVFDYWLAGASLLAGFTRRRFGWLVPVAITLIACVTEPLAGVAFWSLLNNEGPVMLIYGGSLGLASFCVGLIARILMDRLRKQHLPT
jgi:hypothetical protein